MPRRGVTWEAVWLPGANAELPPEVALNLLPA